MTKKQLISANSNNQFSPSLIFRHQFNPQKLIFSFIVFFRQRTKIISLFFTFSLSTFCPSKFDYHEVKNPHNISDTEGFKKEISKLNFLFYFIFFRLYEVLPYTHILYFASDFRVTPSLFQNRFPFNSFFGGLSKVSNLDCNSVSLEKKNY